MTITSAINIFFTISIMLSQLIIYQWYPNHVHYNIIHDLGYFVVYFEYVEINFDSKEIMLTRLHSKTRYLVIDRVHQALIGFELKL
jgi:hypothetical protein